MPRTGARSSRSADAPDAWGIVHKDGCFRGSLAERPLEGEGSGSAPHPEPNLGVADERQLWRTANGVPGGWIGSVGGRPLFRRAFSEPVIPLTARLRHAKSPSRAEPDVRLHAHLGRRPQ